MAIIGRMLAVVLCLVVLTTAVGAEPPPVPDPIGLGERLALIDHLREAYGEQPRAGATLEELRTMYARAWAARQAGPVADAAAVAATADRIARLRRHLAERFGVAADPTLDEPALQELLRRHEAARASRAEAEIAAMAEADRQTPRPPLAAPTPVPGVPPSAASAPAASAQAASAPAASSDGVFPLAFTARGVADCLLVRQGERRCLLVAFGTDHNGAFTGIREGVWARVAQAPAIRRSVLLLGHGGGTDVGGENIEAHLRAFKDFYETMGGTMPAAPIDCLVLASCSAGNPDQMRAMRDGLGYFPTWRVATGPRSLATGISVLAALTDVAARPAQPAWRGLYRMGLSGDAVAAFGEVGIAGERAETSYWRLVPDEDARRWRTVEQR